MRCGTVAAVTYADERLALWQRLRQQSGGQAASQALRLDGESLRFRLGTSLADLRVPLAVDPAIETAAGLAVRELLFLLCLRHRAALRPDEYDQLLLVDGFDPQRLRPASFGPPPSVARQGVGLAFTEAPELHPALDSGTLAAWIGVGRPGRTLIGLVHSLLRRALEEERDSDGREPTPFLVMLGLRLVLPERVSAELKQVPLQAPAGRNLQGAIAAGLLVALRLAARESGVLDSPSGAKVMAALSPLPWLQGGRLLPGSGLQAHGISLPEAIPRVEELATNLEAKPGLDGVLREATGWARGGDLEQRAARSVAHAILRRELLGLARLVESGRAPSLHLGDLSLAQLHGQPAALERTLGAADRRKELVARLKEVARSCGREPDRDRIEGLAAMAGEYREDDPGRCLARGEAERAFSRAIAAMAVDLQLERALLKAQGQLQARSGSEREGGIEEEHERGRLYLLAPRGAILNKRARAQQMGHLFCDVKDFTRRTAVLKEAVVADFLHHEFYTPILTAAARHYRGASHLGDRGGIYLNNLLGDAVSFSGDVASLVELAGDIRRALQGYARRLDNAASSEVLARSIAAIEHRHREKRAHAVSERDKVRFDAERDAELALARGEKLEAGIFVSYGAAPEVATFEDAIFGAIKVAIAEKINESARGTARNGAVRSRVDALVTAARSARGRSDVTCPLSVHIGAPLSIPVAPPEEADVRACLSRGDRQVAEGILLESVRRLIDRMEPDGEQGGDIYNGGIALSDEALQAYLASRGKDLLFLRRDLAMPALHASLQQKFAFPLPHLSMVAGISHTTAGLEELFVYVGRAMFRGFEGSAGLAVWEMIPPQGALFPLIAQHHVPGWLAEHHRGGGEERAGVDPGASMKEDFRGTGSGA